MKRRGGVGEEVAIYGGVLEEDRLMADCDKCFDGGVDRLVE
jgi:hypothetical protein